MEGASGFMGVAFRATLHIAADELRNKLNIIPIENL